MDVLGKYSDVFTDVPGKTNLVEHRVEPTENKPIRSKPYPLPYTVWEELRGKLRKRLVWVSFKNQTRLTHCWW